MEADAKEPTLAEQAYQRLSNAILAGELAAGAKISEPALAREYGISRGPLREALHRLQARNLITRSANQGARVVMPSVQSLAELYVVREALEGMAARLAAEHASAEEIDRLRASVRAPDSWSLDAGGNEGTPDVAYEKADQDFHHAVARSSHNPMLISLLCGELYPLLRLYRGTPTDYQQLRRRAVLEHERIVAAIEDRDGELAEILMRRHILSARKRRAGTLERG
ncbi:MULTISPECIES: GntR family transcriptional regulator [unclassified Achromobacter]|uniref:GntR family transcriptional regulator n=1 Tax=unclassified Achromobacter TaxID=2626865 RepID=UPI000B5180FA|nr:MULTISPECIES: GntR family transcriptional regulator [unclassified Achromobacter]OWT75737.1 GntR family transcriptional regulator [Achromobacter sp. HZ28]OWT76397.1 GntR family transcriptional regulator [Achromobacter sp. HZ34]